MAFSNLFNLESRDLSLRNPPQWFSTAFGNATQSGVTVSEAAAEGLTALYGCIRIISSTISSLPLQVFKDTGKGKEKAVTNPIYKLLHTSPNPEITAYDFKKIMLRNMLISGAGIAEIEFNKHGQPIGLYTLDTNTVKPAHTKQGDLMYEVTRDNHQRDYLNPHELLIFRYEPTADGGWKSPISVFRETIGFSIAVNEYGNKSFMQGINPAGIISGGQPAKTEDAQKALRARFSNYEGLGNSHKIMILEGAEKFERIGLNSADLEFIKTRKLQVAEIARIYSVPLVLLNEETASSWGSGIYEIMKGFVSLTLTPLITSIEAELNSKLIYDNNHYCKIMIDGLLRGNAKDRADAYKTGLMNGYYCINDVLGFEDMNPIENGDVHYVPCNMQTIDKAINSPVYIEPIKDKDNE